MQNAYSQQNIVCILNTGVYSRAMKDPTVSFPIRLPASVRDELKALAEECEVSDQDIMRLALRIGLVDLRSLGKDQARLIKEAADEAGVSFATWAQGKSAKPFVVTKIIDEASLIEKPTADLTKSSACATPANSSVDSPGSSPPSNSEEKTAGIVRLSPPQFVERAKQLRSKVAEEPPAPAKKKRKAEGTND